MSRSLAAFAQAISSRFCRLTAMGLACLAMAGCTNLDLRGEQFRDDAAFDWSGEVRQSSDQADFFGFSNKARQIERNCGAR